MSNIKELSMPEIIKCKRINLITRTHLYDKQMALLLNKNRSFLKQYLRWLDKNKTLQDTINTTTNMMQKWTEKQQFNYLITDKKNNVIGAIGVANINNLDSHVELGYWLCEDKTGMGFMSEAIRKIEQVLFSKKIRRIEIECAITNVASNSVAKRCGFEKECIKKEYFNLNGKFEDAVVYIKMNPNRKN